MQPGDQSTNNDPAYGTPVIQTALFPMPVSHPLPIREFLTTDQPRYRLAQQGASALSDAELLAVITGVPCLETAQRLLIAAGGLRGLQALSTVELQQLDAGISVGRTAQLKAAIELGTRVARGDRLARRQVKSPTDIADLGDAAGIAELTQISPVAWQHINFYGRYEFTRGPVSIDVDRVVAAMAQRAM